VGNLQAFVKSEFAQAQKNLHLEKPQLVQGTFQPRAQSRAGLCPVAAPATTADQSRSRGWRRVDRVSCYKSSIL